MSGRVVLVAAYADNRVIGDRGRIPWHLPEDLAHFKATTLGHTLVMGRATYDSIGRPLPGRTTIVVTRDRGWQAPGVRVAHSVEEALRAAHALPGDVMVVGGAQLYQQTLPFASHQVLTEVHLTPDGDTYYPDFDRRQWRETAREDGPLFSRVWLQRAGDRRTRGGGPHRPGPRLA